MKKQHNLLIVLEALLNGKEIQFNDETKIISELGRFYIRTVTKDDNGKKKPTNISLDCSMNHFKKLCDKMEDSYIEKLKEQL